MSPLKSRRWIAFIVAPLVPSILFFLLGLASRPAGGLWAAKFTLPFTVGATLVGGLPLHLVFRRMGWNSGWAYALIGLVCGLLAASSLFAGTVVNVLTSRQSSPWFSIAAFTLIFCLLGCLSGLVFWAIARPDRQFDEKSRQELPSE